MLGPKPVVGPKPVFGPNPVLMPKPVFGPNPGVAGVVDGPDAPEPDRCLDCASATVDTKRTRNNARHAAPRIDNLPSCAI